METNTGQSCNLQQSVKLIGKCSVHNKPSFPIAKDKVIVNPLLTYLTTSLLLCFVMTDQHSNNNARKANRTFTALCLGLAFHKMIVPVITHCPNNLQGSLIKVNIRPAKSKDLSFSHTSYQS